MMSHPTRYARRRAFTLIELLTVIAIIGILAAILIPTVGRVRESAHVAKTTSNLRQLYQANKMHAGDYKGFFVPHTATALPGNGETPAKWQTNPIFGAYLSDGKTNPYGFSVEKESMLRTGRSGANGGSLAPSLALSVGANDFPRAFSLRESDVDRISPQMIMFGDSGTHWISGQGTLGAVYPWPDTAAGAGNLAFRYSGKATAVLANGGVVRLTKDEATEGENLRRHFPSTSTNGSSTALKRNTPPY